MPRKKRTGTMAAKVGLPPGTLLHVGDTRADRSHIHVVQYTDEAVNEFSNAAIADLVKLVARPGVIWINVRGLHSRAIEYIGQQFNIHSLVLEDILNTNQRPKLEDYGDYVCVILQSLTVNGTTGYDNEQVSLILGPNYVISFLESIPGDKNVLAGVYERIISGRGRIRKLGADYLLYTLIDSLVDQYFLVLENFGDKIEMIEDQIAIEPQPELLRELHAVKQDMLFMRKSVWPVREIINTLERGRTAQIRESTLIYLRDIYDHIIQIIETTEIYRDMLSSMMDIYLSSISNKMNEVVKILTIISTIFIPLTFIAGVYGMNFQKMPELTWEYGYPLIWAVMLAIGLSMVYYFRRRKWL